MRTIAIAAFVAVAAGASAPASAQAPTVSVTGDAVHVRAPAFHFIKGDALARLKDGRALRFDLELGILSRPAGSRVATGRQSFVLSYDLWEERFAVTQILEARAPNGAAPRSVSHLTMADAEAWCLDRVTVSMSALGRIGREEPMWIRIEYRFVDADRAPATAGDDGFSLGGLIDRLSRRSRPGDAADAFDAGPFRIR